MTPAQQHLYFRAWVAAAKTHRWNTADRISAALAAHHAGHVWESPELNGYLTTIYAQAECLARKADNHVTTDLLRRACGLVATGRLTSSKLFCNADFDRVLALLRLLANPADLRNLIAIQDDEAGERRRHLYVITQSPAAYWQHIAQDKFGHPDLDRLSLAQLRQLNLTLRNRTPHPSAAAANPQPDLRRA